MVLICKFFISSLVKIGPMGLEQKIFKFRQYIFAILLSAPLGKGWGPTSIPFNQWCFVPCLVEIGSVVLVKKIFKFRQYIFAISLLSPVRKAGPLVWTNLNSLYPRMLCAKYCWNWPSGSGEEEENVKSWRQQRLWRQRRQRRRTTDKFWSEKITWAFGSGELRTGEWGWKMTIP